MSLVLNDQFPWQCSLTFLLPNRESGLIGITFVPVCLAIISAFATVKFRLYEDNTDFLLLQVSIRFLRWEGERLFTIFFDKSDADRSRGQSKIMDDKS